MANPASEPLEQRLSVVLLTFNCAHRIAPVITHLLQLRLPVIAVDNGSSDGTPDVLETFDDLTVVRLPMNIGAAGRNAGAARAHTPYVLFCDDDGWYDTDGLADVCDLFDEHPALGLLNARILVGERESLDPISAEMADSPLPDRHGLPGAVLLSFMAGAVAVRADAYKEVGGYDERFFIGGEEETLAVKLTKAGWQMRYVPIFVMHHYPSLANATSLRAFGMRNTLVNAWLHRRLASAVKWTAFTLADTPKNADFVRGLLMSTRAVPWIIRERAPMTRQLDADQLVLDQRRFATRRPILNHRDWRPDTSHGESGNRALHTDSLHVGAYASREQRAHRGKWLGQWRDIRVPSVQSAVARSTVLTADGHVACPKCGAVDSFTANRTRKATLLSAPLLTALVAVPKRLRCNGCGANLRRGRKPQTTVAEPVLEPVSEPVGQGQ